MPTNDPSTWKAGAQQRFQVFREGQLAFNSGAGCPYVDWRAGTWAKGREAAKKYHEDFLRKPEPETVPCGLCGTPTPMTGTRRCDRCWELESRIKGDPELARRILDGLPRA